MRLITEHTITINPGAVDDGTTLPNVVPHANALCDRVTDAVPGDVIVYHVGFLARDRYAAISKLTEEQRLELDALADCAARLAEGGWVHLLQRRIGLECFAYLVIVRPRPHQLRGGTTVARNKVGFGADATIARLQVMAEAA